MNRLEKPNKKGEYFEFEVKDFDKNEFDLDEDEGNFIHNFLESFRFYSYFDYISSRKQFEMLHLIHMIFDELVVLKKLNKTIILDYMDLIDKIYINDNSKEASINFYSFYLYYKNNLQEFFGKEIESDFIEKKIDISKNRITYKYNKIDFDNSIIIKYINLLNKLKIEELEEIFPSLEIKKKPAYMMMFENEIPDLIENSCFEFKQIEFQEIITMSVLNILFLNIEKYDINIIKNEIKQLFSVITISLRKYIFRIMYIYYNLCLKQIENKNYSLLSKLNSFIEIFDHLKERNILLMAATNIDFNIYLNRSASFRLLSLSSKGSKINSQSSLSQSSSPDVHKSYLRILSCFCSSVYSSLSADIRVPYINALISFSIFYFFYWLYVFIHIELHRAFHRSIQLFVSGSFGGCQLGSFWEIIILIFKFFYSFIYFF